MNLDALLVILKFILKLINHIIDEFDPPDLDQPKKE